MSKKKQPRDMDTTGDSRVYKSHKEPGMFSRFVSWKLSQENKELQTSLMDRHNIIDELYNEKDMMRTELKKYKEDSYDQQATTSQLRNEISHLEDKISSLEDEKNVVQKELEASNRSLRSVEEVIKEKDWDASKAVDDKNKLTVELKDKEGQIKQLTKKLNDLKLKSALKMEENKNLQNEIDRLRREAEKDNEQRRSQEMKTQKRIKDLEDDIRNQRLQNSALLCTFTESAVEKRELENNVAELRKQLEAMEEKQIKLKLTNTSLETEKAIVEKQAEEMSRCFQNDKEDQQSRLRKETDMLTNRIRELEQEITETNGKVRNLTLENQKVKKENEHLKRLKGGLEDQKETCKTSIAKLEERMATQQASSQTMEKMLQNDIKRLNEQHLADVKKVQETHQFEKEDMQSQMETFFQILTDTRQVKIDTLFRTIQQVVYTRATTNHILQAAFRAYQRKQQQEQQKYQPADNIHELDEDL